MNKIFKVQNFQGRLLPQRNISAEKLSHSDFKRLDGGKIVTRSLSRTYGISKREKHIEKAEGNKFLDF